MVTVRIPDRAVLMLPDNVEITAVPVGPLPLLSALIDRLGIRKVLDELLPKDPRAVVSDTDCVAVMILNIVFGRVALYRMDSWLSNVDLDVVLGEGCPSDGFHDARLGAALDHVYEQGTDAILSSVVHHYLHSDHAPTAYTVHTDTTSLALYGAYDLASGEDAPVPTWGFSKDHRPDLKQLIFGLSLHGAVGIPLVSSMLDGNTSDQEANRRHVQQLASLVRPDDEVTFVADSKLVDRHTLGRLLDEEFHFISLLPGTFALRRDLIDRVDGSAEALAELARRPGKRQSEPDRVYRGTSFVDVLPVQHPRIEGPPGVRHETMRFVVIASTEKAGRFERALPRRLERERESLEKSLKTGNKKPFKCREDAESRRDELVAKLSWHMAEIEVVTEEVAVRRCRRGRPRADEARPTVTEHRLVLQQLAPDEERIALARHRTCAARRPYRTRYRPPRRDGLGRRAAVVRVPAPAHGGGVEWLSLVQE